MGATVSFRSQHSTELACVKLVDYNLTKKICVTSSGGQ